MMEIFTLCKLANTHKPIYTLVQFSSLAQSCLTLCDPMNRSTPGLPVHHQLLEFTQTHVHRVGDAIQPSHPLSSPSPPASNESTLRMRWPKYWSFSFSISPSNKYSGFISFGIDRFDLLTVSVQFSCSVVSDSLGPHKLQDTRPPYPSPILGVHPNSCPSSW